MGVRVHQGHIGNLGLMGPAEEKNWARVQVCMGPLHRPLLLKCPVSGVAPPAAALCLSGVECARAEWPGFRNARAHDEGHTY